MSDQIVRPCILCGRQVKLAAPSPQFAKALREPRYRPVCAACGQLSQTEAVASSGINPQMLDAMDHVLAKNPTRPK
ncbi:MAG TPA: hypothetical protein VD973_20265 [Symbiobacteriaceae bacterium]|jgi:hypothetical protein|nr:hypothetical protein [Symbiobacteriaceae bacterium]